MLVNLVITLADKHICPTSVVMDFTVNSLHTLEEKMNNVFLSVR